MAIEAPTPKTSATNKATQSDFFLCQDFVFRLSTVDGFSHQTFADGSSVTTVNFKSYTQTIPDPERCLFEFLLLKINPQTSDESH